MGHAILNRTLLVLAVVIFALTGVLFVNAMAFKRVAIRAVRDVEISVDRMRAAERLAEAVRFETISHQGERKLDPRGFLGLHAFLERSYPAAHRALTREVVNQYSLVYTWQGTDPGLKPILLMAHLDVVPVEPGTEGEWTHPPFAGRIADGHVWGRGTMDDKASVLGILEAVELLAGQGLQPVRTVYLAFGHDEEIGGREGAGRIAELLKARGVHLEYLLDEGLTVGHGLIPGVAVPVALVGIAEKGWMTLELTAVGPPGHASMPPPHTAIGILGAAIERLEASPMPTRITEPVRQMFGNVGPEMAFIERMAVANLWLTERLVKGRLERKPMTNALVRTTTAATVVQSGAKDNVLPSLARALINVRILPGDTSTAVITHIRHVINDERVTIQPLRVTEPSPVSDPGARSFQTLAMTIRQVFPQAMVAPGLLIAGTDTKHYLSLTDAAYRFIPLRSTPEDVSRYHGVNERIAIDNYAEVIQFYVQLLGNSALTDIPASGNHAAFQSAGLREALTPAAVAGQVEKAGSHVHRGRKS
jgi:carboxypeptidase PM20D1